MPAAVEPAQPPIKLVNTSKSGIKPGQAAALVLVKPVPVPNDATWNAAWRVASPGAS